MKCPEKSFCQVPRGAASNQSPKIVYAIINAVSGSSASMALRLFGNSCRDVLWAINIANTWDSTIIAAWDNHIQRTK